MNALSLNIADLALYAPDDGLRQIRPKHLQIVQLFMKGKTRHEIAEAVGVTTMTVGNIINDPAIKAVWQNEINQTLIELDGLLPLAVDALRKTLIKGDMKQKLTAARDVFKIRGMYKEQVARGDTAEDVMKRITEIYNNVTVNSIQINAVAEPRAAVGAAQQ